ncbi:MAG: hypothetical protein JJT75_05325 [Opitutales bacterium]|nr:hypothetical protein [Opitutales bacterium]MCH8541682.1 hypothetical protein [Opitutales bacterium]
MAKKFFLGCFGIVALVFVAGGILAYTMVYRPLQTGLASLEEIHKANERIENQEFYEPPQDGELTPEQVDRFVTTQRMISQRLEQKITFLQEEYEELGDEWQDREPSIREVMAAWGDIVQLYADAKAIQVDALNEENFSLSEYEFVRSTFYRSIGMELFPYRIDAIAEAAGERQSMMDLGDLRNFEQFEQEFQEIPEEVMEKNRELAAEYSEEVEEWLLFSWWGL